MCDRSLGQKGISMSSTEVAKITRPAPAVWNGLILRTYKNLAIASMSLGLIGGVGTFYWLVIRKKQSIDKLQKEHWNKEAHQKKFDNMNKMKCFTCTQTDKYEWE